MSIRQKALCRAVVQCAVHWFGNKTVIDNTESRRAISFDVCLLRELDNASEQTSSDDNGVMVIAV